MCKPSVFIGSSAEGIDVARVVGVQLWDAGEVTIWNEGVFGPSEGGIESLVNSLDRFDFAVFIFTPDDAITERGDISLAPRDNVMFELGLFPGHLGRSRTFLIRSSQMIKIASDLLGITVLKYDTDRKDRNLLAAVSAPCVPIRDAIRDLGRLDTRGLEQLTRTSSKLQGDVENAVALLARARAFETHLFLKYQGGLFIDRNEADRLKQDIQQLTDVANRFQQQEKI
jgi:hypothetical protein